MRKASSLQLWDKNPKCNDLKKKTEGLYTMIFFFTCSLIGYACIIRLERSFNSMWLHVTGLAIARIAGGHAFSNRYELLAKEWTRSPSFNRSPVTDLNHTHVLLGPLFDCSVLLFRHELPSFQNAVGHIWTISVRTIRRPNCDDAPLKTSINKIFHDWTSFNIWLFCHTSSEKKNILNILNRYVIQQCF